MQATPFFACTEFIACACSMSLEWQARQWSFTSLDEAVSNLNSFEVSVGSAKWAAADPWHPWQPWCSGSAFLSSVVFQCGDFSQELYSA